MAADALTVLFSGAGAGAAAGGVLRFMFQQRLKNAVRVEYEQKLETHKAQLRRETDKEIARLKAELQIAAAERNVRFSRVFERRVTAIEKVHKTLLAFRDSVTDFATLIEPPMKNEKFEAMQNAAKAFKDCFDERINYSFPKPRLISI